MIRRLRTRIIVFVVALLAMVQVVAYVVVSSANSTNAREKIDSELAVGERVFARLLDQNRERLAQAARVMAADYALRGAIASGDQDTVVSALTNHGGRIKADMTLLVSGSPRRRRHRRKQRARPAVRVSPLERAAPKVDTIARLGGDEFAILLENVDERYVTKVAMKILQALEHPIRYEDQPLDVGSSIGIAHFPEHGENSSKLLRNADIAMYVAKRNKGGYAVYDASYDTHQQEHLSLLSEIRQAVEGHQLRVYYQPKVGLLSGVVEGVEALLRWEHPRRGFVSPADFIPFAEHTGYIKVLTRWVLEQAIRQCGQWRATGMPLPVSVNISARDLLNRELPDLIVQLLDRYGTPASLLCLEITESGFMEDPVHSQRVLERLHELGVVLSIDDYGTGYSSLSYVARLPVDELKIDRSFVKQMSDSTTATIVRSTIELGHSLGLKVVAEGVEDEADLRTLRVYGCDQAQGYFESRPLPAKELEEWLKHSPWSRPAGAREVSVEETGTLRQM